jgi:hypothetical protein
VQSPPCQTNARLPIHIVRGMRPDGTPAHIREDSEAIVRGDAHRLANPPLFVKESVEYTAYPDSDQHAKLAAHLIRRGEIPRFVTMPVFAREFTGARPVMLRRQCTGAYKLEPIYRFCRRADRPAPGPSLQHAAVLRDVDRHFGRRECTPLQALPRRAGSPTAIPCAS